MSQAKPFLKWVGGKTQLLPEIRKLFPETCETYFEPFTGGGASFFALSTCEGAFKQAVLNDWNPELVNAYRIVREHPEELMATLDAWKIEHMKSREEHYYQVRALDPHSLTEVERAARMVFLNKAGFNGLYRVNRKGLFNVPWGKKADPTLYERETILACSAALQGVTLHVGDFSWPIATAKAGDLVYFDPPYVPVSATADFTGYTSDGFSGKDQERLAKDFAVLAARGVTAFLSNSDTPVIRDLYKDFEIVTVSARRNINSKGSGRGPVNEVIVTSRSAAA